MLTKLLRNVSPTCKKKNYIHNLIYLRKFPILNSYNGIFRTKIYYKLKATKNYLLKHNFNKFFQVQENSIFTKAILEPAKTIYMLDVFAWSMLYVIIIGL